MEQMAEVQSKTQSCTVNYRRKLNTKIQLSKKICIETSDIIVHISTKWLGT
jgi:hypothetical protein